MELWIRSQNRKDLVLTKSLSMTKGDYEQIGIFASGINIGMYKSKERALEVLDEIHQRLINLGTIEIAPDSYTVLPKDTSNVYEMPEE